MNLNNLLQIIIITPEGIIREVDNLTAVNIPLVNDYIIGIRPGHAPLIAESKQGTLICRTKTSEIHLELHSGVFEVRNNKVIIFTVGEVTNHSSEPTEPSEKTYNRLMQTLMEKRIDISKKLDKERT
jgi:F0F1-type ATP synthase epsilon subunit